MSSVKRDTITRQIVEKVCGERSVAIHNPEKALGIIMRNGMRNNASHNNREIAVGIFETLCTKLGRDVASEILRNGRGQ